MNDTNNAHSGFSAEEIRLTAHALIENFSGYIDTEYFYIETKKTKESA